MKNKSIWKVIAMMVALTFVLTWIIPSSTVGTNSITLGSIRPTGFADIFTSLDVITYYFIKPSIFIIFVIVTIILWIMQNQGLLQAD